MKSVNGKTLVRVDLSQKQYFKIGDLELTSALMYESNNREKAPVIGVVESAQKYLNKGDVIICHHNIFYSAYHVMDDVYSIPINTVTTFARVMLDGSLEPILGNIICERIEKPSEVYLPTDLKEYYHNQYRVLNPGWTTLRKGNVVFTRPFSGYEIVYNINGVVRRAIRVNSEMIAGFV